MLWWIIIGVLYLCIGMYLSTGGLASIAAVALHEDGTVDSGNLWEEDVLGAIAVTFLWGLVLTLTLAIVIGASVRAMIWRFNK